MRLNERVPAAWRNLDRPRIAVASLVLAGHVALLVCLQAAMQMPEPVAPPLSGSVVTLEFLPVEIADAPPVSAAPRPPPARAAPPRRLRSTRLRSTRDAASTTAVLIDSAPGEDALVAPATPSTPASDAFASGPTYKPFPAAPRFTSNLPQSTIRLPDRPSMLQSYWAVPEGENLKGRIARTVPLVGVLLAATGAIGGPHCPPKSEHPECLRRLVEGKQP